MKDLNRIYLAVVTFVCALLLGATVPDESKVLEINALDGSKGTVSFEHKKHTEEYKLPDGAVIACNACHHTLAAAEPAAGEKIKNCSECHVQPDQPQKEHGGKTAPFLGEKKSNGKFHTKKILLHTNCSGCHKKLDAAVYKKLKKCTACHPKEAK